MEERRRWRRHLFEEWRLCTGKYNMIPVLGAYMYMPNAERVLYIPYPCLNGIWVYIYTQYIYIYIYTHTDISGHNSRMDIAFGLFRPWCGAYRCSPYPCAKTLCKQIL